MLGRNQPLPASLSAHERHAEQARQILTQKLPGLTIGGPLEVQQARLTAASAHATLALYELLKAREREAM